MHLMKFDKSSIRGIARENERELTRYKTKVNPELSYMNYNLNPKIENAKDFEKAINDRVKTLAKKPMNRKDIVYLANWVVDIPPDYKGDQRWFFIKAYESMQEIYGKENVISGAVHLDETTPHIHIGFMPVKDNKLDAKHLLNKDHLKEMHPKLEQMISQKLGMKVNLQVENRDPFYNKLKQSELTKINEIKKLDREIEIKNTELKGITNQVKIFEMQDKPKERDFSFSFPQPIKKTFQKDTEITLNKNDFENLQNQFLEKQNQFNLWRLNELNTLNEKEKKLKEKEKDTDISFLKNENENLKETISNLRIDNKSLTENVREYQKELLKPDNEKEKLKAQCSGLNKMISQIDNWLEKNTDINIDFILEKIGKGLSLGR